MILSAHQPAYLPWLGYFDKIKRSDIFIFMDDVQFEKNSFTNRNKINTSNGPIWLTIPVIQKNHLERRVNDMMIDQSGNWRKKHLNSIYYSYKKSPNFPSLYPKLELLYGTDFDKLTDLTWSHLSFWLNELGIKTKTVKSSSLGFVSKKSDLVLDYCKAFDADYYISGAMGVDYLDEDKFNKNGIRVEFQNYEHPVYPQQHGEFVSNMGIVDFAMNCNDYSVI